MKGNKKTVYPYLESEMLIKGESRADLAELLDLSKSAVNRRLTGVVDWSLEEVKAICKHYNKTTEELFKKVA